MTKTHDLQPDMDVLCADGEKIGKVERQDGPDRIKIAGDEYDFISWDWVDRVEDGKLLLNMDAGELKQAVRENPDAHIR